MSQKTRPSGATATVELNRTAPRRATISQVAQEAGVAVATVSSVLNNRPECFASDATRQRVRAAAIKLGYRPSLMARALHGKATATLGLVLPAFDLIEPTIRRMAAFEAGARHQGYVTITACTRNEPGLEDRALRNLLDRHVDAIAIYPTENGPHLELQRLHETGIHVVTFDGDGRISLPCDDVSADCVHTGRLQAEHLLSLGRRKIAVLNTLPSCHVNNQKTAGVQQALLEAGCRPAHQADFRMPIQTANHADLREFAQVEQFIEEHGRRFDGLAAHGDMLAMAAMRAAIRIGLRVPDDLAIIGCGDNISSRYCIPSLSSVRHDAERTGAVAFDMLQRRIAGDSPAAKPTRILIPAELLVRESTAGAQALQTSNTENRS